MTKDSEQIYHSLLRQIVTMDIKPGTMLREIEISERFKVSRTPIRDVFKKLECDGLLVIQSQKGSYVSKIDLNGITDIMFIREEVELSVLSDLIDSETTEDLQSLKEIVDRQNKLLSQNDAFIEEKAAQFFDLDNLFHQQIYAKVKKEGVLNILNSSWPSFSRFRYLTFLRDYRSIERLCSIHGRILKALEDRDKTLLPEIVKEHNFSGLDGIDGIRLKHPEYFK